MADQLLSSPDPLALSNENLLKPSPTNPRGAILTPRKALANTFGNAHVQDFYLSTPPARITSPNKSPKHRAQSTSPWRIRLTVQAEQVNGTQYEPGTKTTPTARHAVRTTTTSVPLKGGGDTPQAVGNRGRGRPRKSWDGPVKSSGTPKPKKNARRKTVPEPLEEQDDSFLPSRTTPAKKARGRPRKSIEPVVDTPQVIRLKPSMDTSDIEGANKDAAGRKTMRRKSRARRMEITPMKVAVNSDRDSGIEATGLRVEDSIGGCRLGTDGYLQEMKPVEICAFGKPLPEKQLLEEHDEDMWRAMIRRQSQSPDADSGQQQDQEELDPTNEHQEYDTILESEGFSMVSVSSLASAGNRNTSPVEQGGEQNVPDQDSKSVAPSPVIPPLQKRREYSEARDHTPAIAPPPLIPPVLQNAPQQSPRRLKQAKDGTPKLAHVVRAGNALQGALGPKEQKALGSPFRSLEKNSALLEMRNVTSQRRHSSPGSKARSPTDQINDLFSGFGARTRRELKAGLRLGEELARNQRQMSQKPESFSNQADDASTTSRMTEHSPAIRPEGTRDDSTKAQGPKQAVQYPLLSNNQLPSPDWSVEDLDEDRMSWEEDTPMKPEYPAIVEEHDTSVIVSLMNEPSLPQPSHDKATSLNTSGIDHTMLAREAEWQRERETVSQRIELTNKSQIIVIDGDDDVDAPEHGEDEDGSDIWQAEASQSREPTLEASEGFPQPEVVKPRRSKLPSPWRRNSEVVYSDEVEPTEADLFWQPDRSRTKAPKKQVDSSDNSAKYKAEDSTSAFVERQINPVDGLIDEDSLNKTSKVGFTTVSIPAEKVKPKQSSLLDTPDEAHFEEFNDVREQNTTFSQVGNRTIDNLPVADLAPAIHTVSIFNSTSASDKVADSLTDPQEDVMAAIDPLILQKPAQNPTRRRVKKATEKQVQEPIQAPAQRPSSAILPLSVCDTQTSWMSRFTAPIWRAFTSLPPPATKEDILCSGPYEPLCQFTPWEECHFRALQPLYYASLLYGSHIFPYNRCHITAAYLGMKVETQGGWSRTITEADCGVTNAFMVILEERGFALAEQPGERWIDEGLVVKQCVALWVGMVMKGEVEVDQRKGEKIGLRKEGDRLWTKDDIDWAHNRSEYLERKKREFDGLPSWKEKGIQWR
ncbi:hypothetical protein N7G274_005014 [Stereocaulon virgatum]|uniref:Uncharacterized protein n=1 Tax=Stereocaulon virgatum TaxID=373712 RepID=A0ABR4AAM0_9LECA